MCKSLLASINSPRLCGHSVGLVFNCDSRVVSSLFSIPPKNLGDPGSSRGTLERIRAGLTIYMCMIEQAKIFIMIRVQANLILSTGPLNYAKNRGMRFHSWYSASVCNVHRHLENIIQKAPKCEFKKDWSLCKNQGDINLQNCD